MDNSIKDFVKQRGIKHLKHFTKLSNLGSILQSGLVTRDVLVHEGKDDALNDRHRHDNTNAVCVSIGFPNYKMFWGLRQDHPDTDWVIVVISKSALWELQCAFCVANAASTQISTTPLEQRMTLDALRSMYDDFDDKTRIQLGLTDDLPTNPQAEVLMLEGVPIQYIQGVYVQNDAIKAKVQKLHPKLKVIVNENLFCPRSDYTHWKAST